MKCHSFLTIVSVFVCTVLINELVAAEGNVTGIACSSKKTCGECLRTPDCVWCAQEFFIRNDSSPIERCNTATKHQQLPAKLRCAPEFLINPNNEYEFIRDEATTIGQNGRVAIQIRPQHVQLKIRVGQAQNILMEYTQVDQYPVDLYYLMDLSQSMDDDKAQLSALGDTLAETMKRLTTNFRLGFGSFVDKVVMPYVSTVEKNLIQPCPGCEAPYGFQHVMSLSRDTSSFSGQVRDAKISGNLDAPEGGFDAIMQAIACDQQIGWRQEARKIIVFSTDASFHYAGDGKLGGIVKPNDGLCHLDSRGEYTHSTLQDYPSVAQINSKVKEKSINMIFAVTQEQQAIYQKLKERIQGASCGVLSANSSNVVDLVRSEYEKITQTVQLEDTASSFIRVTYFSKCKGDVLKETNVCEGLRRDDSVEFTIKVEVNECPANRADWRQTFNIYRVGINESMTVDLEIMCECPCEVPGNPGFDRYSPFCNGRGNRMCGICDCEPSFFGRKCECDASTGSRYDDDRGCRKDNTTDIICSNQGTCVCGQCECNIREDENEKIEGQFCECDNFSCDRENGLLCSGEGHGRCECGRCICAPGWEGPACQCSTDKSNCFEPGSKEECSGKGSCVCGKCVCNENESERFSGKFCQKCPTCKGRCEEYKDCVQCKTFGTGKHEKPDHCDLYCRDLPAIEMVDVVNNEESEEHYCLFVDESDDCRFYFVYGYDINNNPYIKAQKTKDCPPEAPVLWIVSGVVGGIVLIGMFFVLFWKLLTHIKDRAEYASFEKERMNAKWDTGENPIYKQATSTFKNPMYAGR